MEQIRGLGVSRGMVHGKIIFVRPGKQGGTSVKRAVDPDAEAERFRNSCRILQEELENLYTKTKETLGEKEAEIFTIHQMMLADEGFTEIVEACIAAGKSAEQAVTEAGNTLADSFAAMDNAYMQAREADIRSLAERLTEILQGKQMVQIQLTEPCILAIHDLSPAQTMELDPKMVLGFITEQGSVNSHTAILARTLGIPAITAAGRMPEQIHGKEAVLDGSCGILYITPDKDVLQKYKLSAAAESREREKWQSMRGHRCTGRNGIPIQICSNAGSLEDITAAVENDAEGIGLFRSEFLFMQFDRYPTEEEQYTVYCSVLEKMQGRDVVIRTLDAGADKKISWLPCIPGEANPALGFRAIRICLRYPELLMTQLRALYRASAGGKIHTLIPMIALPSELDRVLQIAEEVQKSLRQDSVPFDEHMPIGIMIETPSAALQAEVLAGKAAFFSIGTNDLMQYTMAADRENDAVSYLTETVPESVKKLIRMTSEAAAKAGIPVSVCGELAGNPDMIPFFLQEGITKLSVSPRQILRVRLAVQSWLTKSVTQK